MTKLSSPSVTKKLSSAEMLISVIDPLCYFYNSRRDFVATSQTPTSAGIPTAAMVPVTKNLPLYERTRAEIAA